MEKKIITHLLSPKGYMVMLLIVVMACIPIFIREIYILHLMALIGIYTIYSSSWNLLAYSGQASLGHAAFLGIGGFAATLLAVYFGVPPWLSLLVGGAFASGMGFLVGLTCVRLREWFLAMVTFGFAVIAQTVTHVLDKYTHGVLGYSPPPLVSSKIQYYYAILSLAATTVLLIYLIMKSKIGLAFSAIRENELEAKMMGVNTAKYKLIAFMMSTFFAGLSGALLAYFTGHISEYYYNAENSFMPLMMTLIGGLGTIEGPIIGSITIRFIEELLHNLPVIKWIINGVVLITVVIFLPKGISSLLRKALKR